jgi:hypothetical protein
VAGEDQEETVRPLRALTGALLILVMVMFTTLWNAALTLYRLLEANGWRWDY